MLPTEPELGCGGEGQGEGGDPEEKEGVVQEGGGEGPACMLSCPARESIWRGE